MNAVDRQRTWALTGVAAAVFNPAINFVLIPYFDRVHGNGAIGAATSTVFTELFMMTAALIYLRGSVFDAATRSVALRCAVSGALMVGTVGLARGLPLPLSVLIGGATSGTATLALGVIRLSDVNDLRRYVTSRAAAGAPASA
jgi:O-antigen/teichoic acid export membrane protein